MPVPEKPIRNDACLPRSALKPPAAPAATTSNHGIQPFSTSSSFTFALDGLASEPVT